jgi:lipoate-protein ligase A
MAIDEALLLTTARKQAPPTLRLYDWQPICLSLGFAQPFIEVNRDKLDSMGWTLVRRPTGGRAILHKDEITYSIAASQEERLVSGSLLESYRRISEVLLKALQMIGIECRADSEYENLSAKQRSQPVCFEVPSNYEITANDRKLIGSAQARKDGGVLQHGSLPLCGDLGTITEVLNFTSEEARISAQERVHNHATTLEEVLHRRVSWSEAADAFIRAFSETLGETLTPSEISPAEQELAQKLLISKYASSVWNERI